MNGVLTVSEQDLSEIHTKLGRFEERIDDVSSGLKDHMRDSKEANKEMGNNITKIFDQLRSLNSVDKKMASVGIDLEDKKHHRQDAVFLRNFREKHERTASIIQRTLLVLFIGAVFTFGTAAFYEKVVHDINSPPPQAQSE